ncbi:hypothetical protein FB451DRAFT_1191206 [Mycena latifolia]|nr:hypothetical protein FB451DRAFT_1191206 [Mycena latifolia]
MFRRLLAGRNTLLTIHSSKSNRSDTELTPKFVVGEHTAFEDELSPRISFVPPERSEELVKVVASPTHTLPIIEGTSETTRHLDDYDLLNPENERYHHYSKAEFEEYSALHEEFEKKGRRVGLVSVELGPFGQPRRFYLFQDSDLPFRLGDEIYAVGALTGLWRLGGRKWRKDGDVFVLWFSKERPEAAIVRMRDEQILNAPAEPGQAIKTLLRSMSLPFMKMGRFNTYCHVYAELEKMKKKEKPTEDGWRMFPADVSLPIKWESEHSK